jgi:hypothetical protein
MSTCRDCGSRAVTYVTETEAANEMNQETYFACDTHKPPLIHLSGPVYNVDGSRLVEMEWFDRPEEDSRNTSPRGCPCSSCVKAYSV